MVAAVCAAETETAPVVARIVPVPNRAVVVLFTSESARTGVSETPPDDPASAVVVTSCVADAVNPTACAPVKIDPLPTSATDRFATMFNPTDAPIPTVAPVAPPPTGLASAVVWVRLSAVSVTSPAAPPVITTVAPFTMLALLSVSIRFSASDPAIPTLPAPAPEVALVKNTSEAVSVLAAEAINFATSRLNASIAKPPTLCTARPNVALFSTFTALTATAAPMPIFAGSGVLPLASLTPTAAPLAVALPTALLDVRKVSVPAVVITFPVGTTAETVAF